MEPPPAAGGYSAHWRNEASSLTAMRNVSS